MYESVRTERVTLKPPAVPARFARRASRAFVSWLHARIARAGIALLLLEAIAVASAAAPPTPPAPTARAAGYWGAIASRPDGNGYGYAYDQPSRAVAEQVARAQCEQPAGKPTPPGLPRAAGACEMRVWFQRGCGALAAGNFGEWGAAVGADKTAAAKAAARQCDAHLPTEPCRAVVSVCSLP